MAIYKSDDDIEATDVWLHMRSFATTSPGFVGHSYNAEYGRKEIKCLTESLARLVRMCVDESDARITGCDMDLLQAILDEDVSDD